MSLYFKDYTLKQKIVEYGELSCKRKALEANLLNNSKLKDDKLFKLIQSGEVNNIIVLSDLAEILADKIEEI